MYIISVCKVRTKADIRAQGNLSSKGGRRKNDKPPKQVGKSSATAASSSLSGARRAGEDPSDGDQNSEDQADDGVEKGGNKDASKP